MNILLIEDDRRVLNSMSDALDLNGFPNEKFSNPKEAINAYMTRRFDVVVTDLIMSEMNGIEVLKMIKEHNPRAYVIVITGYPSVENAIEALNNSAYAYFKKPVDMGRFIITLFNIELNLNMFNKITGNIQADILTFIDTLSVIDENLNSLKEIIDKIQDVKKSLDLKEPSSTESQNNDNQQQRILVIERNISLLLEDIQLQYNVLLRMSTDILNKAFEVRNEYSFDT